MHKQSTEFDRTFFKTHKSRYTKFTPPKTAGFTLIELLVVISIIALLSTVVLAAVNDGRVKARNTAKNSLVLEYVKALELYRDSNTSYYISGASPVCIGYLASENCLGSSLLTGSSGFNASLSTYLPSDFAHKQSLMNGTTDYRGVTYQSLDGNSYVLRWILESNITQCINNSTSGSSGGNTVCTYTIN